MNRSYSKIRHIQESNILLERRSLNEQNWSQMWDAAKGVVFGPLAYTTNPSSLAGLLGTNTGEKVVKAMVDQTPMGILKNMSTAAARGDANSFSQAWEQAKKTSRTDLTAVKDAAFQDMKSFGKLLQKLGF